MVIQLEIKEICKMISLVKLLNESTDVNHINSLIKDYIDLPLECDGLTRVLTYILKKNNIPHTVCTGSIHYKNNTIIHYWIKLPDGYYIDYRARMWMGNDKSVPNGIFNPKDYPEVTYKCNKNGNLEVSDTIFQILTNSLSENVDYDKRMKNVRLRNYRNKLQSSLSEEQHEALAELTSLRHKIHTNKDSIIKSSENNDLNELVKLNVKLNELGIPIPTIPTDESDYIDIDNIDTLKEVEDISSENEDYQEWYDDNYNRISSDLEKLNNTIEKYLSKIDTEHNTTYKPTGSLRF